MAVEREDAKGINFMGQFSKKVKQFRQCSLLLISEDKCLGVGVQ